VILQFILDFVLHALVISKSIIDVGETK
jgi:hypothetical protein